MSASRLLIMVRRGRKIRIAGTNYRLHHVATMSGSTVPCVAAGAMPASQPACVKVKVERNVSIADSSDDVYFDLETQCQQRTL